MYIMDRRTTGTIISAAKQWWLKINTKPIRKHAWDGAIFPYIIKVRYTVNGIEYTKRKWIVTEGAVPTAGCTVTVAYSEKDPSKAKVLL